MMHITNIEATLLGLIISLVYMAGRKPYAVWRVRRAREREFRMFKSMLDTMDMELKDELTKIEARDE